MSEKNYIEDLYRNFKSSEGVTTDSRKVGKGMIYFALRGERFDGNKFAHEAIEKGAMLAVVDDQSIADGDRIIKVNDSLLALQELAKMVRSKWSFPVLAIAGSNGKTTTKELIAAVLGKKYKVFSTPGNYNNHIGLPLTILMTPEDTEFLVLEMGANHLVEHRFLCGIAKPDYGLVTNNGLDHLEGYGSYENVKKSNGELYDFLNETSGKAFVNAGDPELLEMSEGLTRITYAINSDEADFHAETLDNDIFASLKLENGQEIRSRLAGEYNAINILAALSVGNYFSVETTHMSEAISEYEPRLNRSQFIRKGNFDVLLDAYNSNPSSLGLALQSLQKTRHKRKMVILGAMLELGSYEESEHRKAFEKLLEIHPEKIWLVGEQFRPYAGQENTQWFENGAECKKAFENLDFKDGIVLIKGSRKFELEKLIS